LHENANRVYGRNLKMSPNFVSPRIESSPTMVLKIAASCFFNTVASMSAHTFTSLPRRSIVANRLEVRSVSDDAEKFASPRSCSIT
jgi:hypothetical protein